MKTGKENSRERERNRLDYEIRVWINIPTNMRAREVNNGMFRGPLKKKKKKKKREQKEKKHKQKERKTKKK